MNYRERKQKELYNQYVKYFNDYTDIKDVIRTHLIRNDNKFNSRMLSTPSFENSKAHNEIKNITAFLSDSVKITERLYCVLNDITTAPKCVICNTPSTFLPNAGKGYSKTCGNQSCKTKESNERRLETCVKKYGAKISPNTRQKIIERANELQVKGRKTVLDKYGVNNISKIEEVKQKKKDTLIKNYDVDHISHIPHVIEKRKNDRVEFLQTLSSTVYVIDIIDPIKQRQELYNTPCDRIKFICNTCKTEQLLNYETFKWRSKNVNNPCTKCSGLKNGSALEQQVSSYVKKFDPDIRLNDRSLIAPYELDIISDKFKIAIEFNGLFWHSYNEIETKKQRNYHLNKTEKTLEAGYQLIHIFENEWVQSKEKVISRLMSVFNQNDSIYARCCDLIHMNAKQASSLIDDWHLQGNTNASVYIGLEYKDQIVSIMSFRTPRFNNKIEWEIIRFCSKPGVNIIGGGSKIFREFIKTYTPNTVISYADRKWGEGNLYKYLGFERQKNTIPSYYYIDLQKGLNLYHRTHFQKHKLSKKLINYNSNLTEAENMFLNGYRRIWDCGHAKYIWKKDK